MQSVHKSMIKGTQSYTSAIATAIKRAAHAGATVLYPSGKRDKIDVAIRRAAVTGVNQTVSKLLLEHAKELDCDLVEVTAHMGAREEHVSWQGGIFSLVGRKGQYDDFYKVTGYGSGPGLCGWNCSYSFYPFYEGSASEYSKEQLEEYNKTVGEYKGKKHNDYEASQRQRYYERQIRQTKRELVGYNSAISSTKDEALKKELRAQFTQSSVKLKAQEARMREFLKATNRLEDNSRTQVLEFNKSVSQKAVWAEKKAKPRKEHTKVTVDIQLFAKKSKDFKTVILPREEYAHVMTEVGTHLSKYDRQKKIIKKPIGNYVYTLEKMDTLEYRVIGKELIEDSRYDELHRFFK